MKVEGLDYPSVVRPPAYRARPDALITTPYRAQQRLLHASQVYGHQGDRWAPVVRRLVEDYDASSVLDYGCGSGALRRALVSDAALQFVRIDEYDPAIDDKDMPPVFADLVVCTDVLEHVEPQCLDAVLEHLRILARKAVFLVVSTRPSHSTLSDGRNAHLIIESDAWWRARVEAAGFTVQAQELPSEVKRPSQAWIAVVTK